jgi:hypothetical protein
LEDSDACYVKLNARRIALAHLLFCFVCVVHAHTFRSLTAKRKKFIFIYFRYSWSLGTIYAAYR